MLYSLQKQGFELIVALVTVLSERELAKQKLSGWVLAIFSSALTAVFFVSRGHSILGAMEAINVPFSVYGFV